MSISIFVSLVVDGILSGIGIGMGGVECVMDFQEVSPFVFTLTILNNIDVKKSPEGWNIEVQPGTNIDIYFLYEYEWFQA